MLIARIEALIAGLDTDAALKRAAVYLEAGADAIVIHSRKSEPTEVFEFAKKYRQSLAHYKKPLIAIPTTYNIVKEDELHAAGFNIVIYANHLLRASFKSMNQVAERILQSSRSLEAEKEFCARLPEVFELIERINHDPNADSTNSQPACSV